MKNSFNKVLCLSAFVVAALVACSEDSESVAGGAVEDLGVVANHDTVFVHDSVKVKVKDTVRVHDSVKVKVKDTVLVHDSVKVKVKDTVRVHDSVKVKVKDTVFVHDSVKVKDVVVVKDTVNTKDTVVILKGFNLSGFAQKGPFLKGSEVTLYELDASNGVKPTGKSLTNLVSADDGSFSFEGVSFNGGLVGASVTGRFYNEMYGTNNFYPVTLRGISDMSEGRTTMNVNVMTALEYDRVIALMQEDPDMTFASAKKQAEKEAFAVFGIDATDFKSSEDLDLFGSSDGDAALLAVSLILLRVAPNDALTDLMATLSRDLADNGKIDDETLVENLVMSAEQSDLGGRVFFARGSLLALNISDDVLNFGKYVQNFWQKMRGMEECTDENVGEVVFLGENHVYACVDSSDASVGKTWRWATAIDYDTLGYGHDYVDGYVKYGSVNKDSVYVFENGAFRRCIEWECSLAVGCVKEGDTYRYDGEENVYYKNYNFECVMTEKGLRWKVIK